MKKCCMILAVLLLISQISGCGDPVSDLYEGKVSLREPAHTAPESEPVHTVPDRAPTQQEQEDLERYAGILAILDGYAVNKYVMFDSILDEEPVDIDAYEYCIDSEDTGITGYDGLKILRDLLRDMEHIDPWIGTEYAPYISREEVLSRFYVVKDVLLSETVVEYGYDGVVDGYEVYFWSYDEEGRRDGSRACSQDLSILYFTDPLDITYFVCGNPGTYSFSYDDEGRLSRIECPAYGNFSELELYYGETGGVSSLTGKSRSGEAVGAYSYDSDDKLREIRYSDEFAYSLKYGYDEDGRLIWASYGAADDRGPGMVYTYTYDEAGVMVQIDTPEGSAWQLTYDAEGRLLKAFSGGEDGGDDRILTYGNYYGYDPG